MSGRYTYGDTELAARRLTLLSRTFESSTRSFLEAAGPSEPALAVDLGCGPGLTTRLLQEVTRAIRTAGLDASAAYVDRARADAPPHVEFHVHDATEVPFPVGTPDVIYARLLLAHLRDPASVIERWCSALSAGGVVLVDDLEAIETDDPACRAYLEEVAVPVVRSEGGHLLVGPAVHAMADPPSCTRLLDRVHAFTPPVADSARLFLMNLGVLEERGEVRSRPDIAHGLRELVHGERAAEPVTWRMRQVAWRRARVA